MIFWIAKADTIMSGLTAGLSATGDEPAHDNLIFWTDITCASEISLALDMFGHRISHLPMAQGLFDDDDYEVV